MYHIGLHIHFGSFFSNLNTIILSEQLRLQCHLLKLKPAFMWINSIHNAWKQLKLSRDKSPGMDFVHLLEMIPCCPLRDATGFYLCKKPTGHWTMGLSRGAVPFDVKILLDGTVLPFFPLNVHIQWNPALWPPHEYSHLVIRANIFPSKTTIIHFLIRKSC